jgi:hypothetical protein
MWMSVPQIAVFLIRIFTSFGPTAGTGASDIQMPSLRSSFERTRIVVVIRGGIGSPHRAGKARDARRARVALRHQT